MVLRPDPSNNGSAETTPVSSKQIWNNQAILLFTTCLPWTKNTMCGLYRSGCGSCHFRHQGADLLKSDASFLRHSIRMTEEIIHSMCLPGFRPNLCRNWPSIETITTMSTFWNYDSLRNVCVTFMFVTLIRLVQGLRTWIMKWYISNFNSLYFSISTLTACFCICRLRVEGRRWSIIFSRHKLPTKL